MHVHTHKHTHTVMSKLLKKDIQYFDMSPQDRCGSVLVYALLISACGGGDICGTGVGGDVLPSPGASAAAGSPPVSSSTLSVCPAAAEETSERREGGVPCTSRRPDLRRVRETDLTHGTGETLVTLVGSGPGHSNIEFSFKIIFIIQHCPLEALVGFTFSRRTNVVRDTIDDKLKVFTQNCLHESA